MDHDQGVAIVAISTAVDSKDAAAAATRIVGAAEVSRSERWLNVVDFSSEGVVTGHRGVASNVQNFKVVVVEVVGMEQHG